jgi:hypothetical protein
MIDFPVLLREVPCRPSASSHRSLVNPALPGCRHSFAICLSELAFLKTEISQFVALVVYAPREISTSRCMIIANHIAILKLTPKLAPNCSGFTYGDNDNQRADS